MNQLGIVFSDHLDVWLTNNLLVLLKATKCLIPDSVPLTGWVNGDLYTPGGETITILRIPDSTCAYLDLQLFDPSGDEKLEHKFLARCQGTKYTVISIHTNRMSIFYKVGKLLYSACIFSA